MAGLCYIVVIVLGVSKSALVSSRLPTLADPEAVVAVLVDQGLRFRLGVLSDIVLYVLVLVLSAALYVVVHGIHRSLALAALTLRSAEAVVGLSATVVGGVGSLLLLSGPARVDPTLVVASLALQESAFDLILVLVGLGGATFCYLFLRSRLVPGWLALWGVVTYASMVVLGAARVLWPGLPPSITSVLFAQGALFELLFGLWLVVKAAAVADGARAPVTTGGGT